MIKTVYEKWMEIEKEKISEGNFHIAHFYLSKKTKTNIYFGIKDNNKIVYLEFTPEALSSYVSPTLLGMDIAVEDANFIDSTKKYIVIKNITNSSEIFLAFVSSLCDELVDTEDYLDAFQCLSKVIKDYRDYFSNPNFTLSLKEEQGLCAELLELNKIISRYGEGSIVNWQGPNKNKRDF